MNKLKLFFILLFLSAVSSCFAQTIVKGTVKNSQTGEVLPFVNIFFPGTQIGAISDEKGKYSIRTNLPVDSVAASFVGFTKKVMPIAKGRTQYCNFLLNPKQVALGEITVYAGENPAHVLLEKVIDKKTENNIDNLSNYSYEVYNKIQFDFTNINENISELPIFRDYDFVFDYINTTNDGKVNYLPFFLSESLADYYYQKKPEKIKEIIKANKISGIENESVREYTGNMYLDVNIYENYINIFNKPFVSPIANFGLLAYEYYLVDSSFIDNCWCYNLKFKPRRKQELTFYGNLWIADTSYAVKKVKARIAPDANINFIQDIIVEQHYKKISDTLLFPNYQKVFINFYMLEKMLGIFGHKTTSYDQIKINQKFKADFFSHKEKQQSQLLPNASKKSNDFWNNNRHTKLNAQEKGVYEMIDSIKNAPKFKRHEKIAQLLTWGYWVQGNFEYGPVYKFYSKNELEGHRFRFGGRTSNDFSTKFMLYSHLAFGTRDEKFKYQLGSMYMFSKEPRRSAGISYSYDAELLGHNQMTFDYDDIMTSALSRKGIDDLLMADKLEIFYEREWFTGFSNQLEFRYRKLYPTDFIPFIHAETNENLNAITTSEIHLNTHFAWNEKFVYGEFIRTSLGSKYPILDIDLTLGLKNIFLSDYSYFKLHTSIFDKINIGPLGRFHYRIFGGKIWGDVPYLLLRMHEGNQTYVLEQRAFNMMNYYEFVSDEYFGLHLEHHFMGLFLNKIPLIKKLKMREVIEFRGLYGNLNKQHSKILAFPQGLGGLKKPYLEIGAGLENIFKVIRIEAVWRLNYLDNPDVQNFAILTTFQIDF